MLKHLKIYYLFVSLPFILLLAGASVFIDGIKYTLVSNPHPQINIIIFTIILVGGILILFNSRRLMREAKTLVEFARALHAKKDQTTLTEMANGYNCDIACLLQMIASSADRSISHQEQAALEHELTNVRSRLNRRNALPSYLTGLLVGMGLLGTFIGLLATLADISTLISSFADIDMQNASPLVVFKTMIERMKAPMQSMGIAFSASMFGLLGSIILGLMMVGIRRLQNDIFSVLSSEVARHIELALSFESISFRGGEIGTPSSGETGDLTSKILIRIEERLAEAARIRQRALSAEIDDFKKQRADMLQAMAEQTEANVGFQHEMQQLGSKLGAIFGNLEKGTQEVLSQFSELRNSLTGDAQKSQKLLASQVEEQKRLCDTIASFNMEERFSGANAAFRNEMQQVGNQLATMIGSIEKAGDEISSQLSELTVHASADAKETHRLLNITSNNVRAELQGVGAQIAEMNNQNVKASDELAGQIAKLASQQAEESGSSQAQNADMLQLLANQIEAGQKLHAELQQLSSRVEAMIATIDQGNTTLSGQIAELAKASTSSARESQGQRSDLLQSLSQQVEMSTSFNAELQKLGDQFETVLNSVGNGSGEPAEENEERE